MEWKMIDRIEKMINRNCKEIPWEGTEVDKGQLKQDIMDLIEEIEGRYEYNPVKEMREERDRRICG